MHPPFVTGNVRGEPWHPEIVELQHAADPSNPSTTECAAARHGVVRASASGDGRKSFQSLDRSGVRQRSGYPDITGHSEAAQAVGILGDPAT
jgi:hypothetical protein